MQSGRPPAGLPFGLNGLVIVRYDNLPCARASLLRVTLSWDRIDLTGDCVWSETATYDADGLRPLNSAQEPMAA
jgi:hypothetical protein